MTDIDAAFRRSIGADLHRSIYGQTTTSSAGPSDPLTIEKLRQAMADLGPPLPPQPRVKVSEHATAEPSTQPHTDDMRAMAEALGRKRVPACLKLSSMFGGMFVIHPDLIDSQSKDKK